MKNRDCFCRQSPSERQGSTNYRAWSSERKADRKPFIGGSNSNRYPQSLPPRKSYKDKSQNLLPFFSPSNALITDGLGENSLLYVWDFVHLKMKIGDWNLHCYRNWELSSYPANQKKCCLNIRSKKSHAAEVSWYELPITKELYHSDNHRKLWDMYQKNRLASLFNFEKLFLQGGRRLTLRLKCHPKSRFSCPTHYICHTKGVIYMK